MLSTKPFLWRRLPDLESTPQTGSSNADGLLYSAHEQKPFRPKCHSVREMLALLAVNGVIVLSLAELRDTSDSHYQTSNLIAHRMTLFSVKQHEGFLFDQSSENQIHHGFLPFLSKYPRRGKWWRFVQRQRHWQALINLLLTPAQAVGQSVTKWHQVLCHVRTASSSFRVNC
jgi:hypothetical protein